jgi:hypothetical protein
MRQAAILAASAIEADEGRLLLDGEGGRRIAGGGAMLLSTVYRALLLQGSLGLYMGVDIESP